MASEIAAVTDIPASPEMGTATMGLPNGPRSGIVSLRLAVESPILPFDSEHARAGEQYRMARTKIMQDPRQPRLIAISSAGS